ncbi:vomeronasal type-2 receptor 26-like [Bufo bufo]|uniref:vomeronasal type-2 receptor 26-like n=1 Tax=Bufo bufo TaxID=8384 RepID=UPI001ABE3C64|nr:vomeronasal type-2 receptor 26-like [Bufo bufo]
MTLYSFPLLRKYTFTKPPVFPPCLGITLRYYRHFLAILFAIQEINESHVLLPNITMGLEIYDSCAYESRALESTMKLLTGDQNTIPNYQYKNKGPLVGIIGHIASSPTKTMAKLTGVYSYPQLNKYLRSIHFNTSNGENFYFENGESPGKYDILNWIITPNKTIQTVHIGTYVKSALPARQLIINESLIQWNTKFKEVPHSVCSNSCLPGYRKVLRKAEQKCCYDCVMCSEGEITNNTDMTNCLKCSEYQWSNEKRDKCISRSIDFLSYEDPLGISLCFFAVQLSLLTLGVFAIFFKHKETPIVKANNRDLSYILLLSLTLSFLCALLFIGRPDTITCHFQQAAFGIVFTIAISSILAKTVTVLIAFNSVKPGSKARKWMSSQVSMYLVCICSFGEIVICFVGFLYSPPFPDFDTRERSLRMTLHCNQGYAMTFYVAVGYMTLLAVLSFVIAFLARKLPDNFNEASHITFSMLVFCSVWLSFFPAYLSTKGKYTTAVEIFAMLASSTGLLTCIFLPKCYIIIIRPDLNTKQSITGKKEKFSNYSIEVK